MSKVVVPNDYCTAVPLLKVPMIKPLPTVNLSESECEILRRWASAYGAAIQQRTVRQETTMSKHGTLPDFVYQYQRQLAVDERVTLNFRFDENEDVSEDHESNQSEDDGESDDNEGDEFDESSSEEVDLSVTGDRTSDDLNLPDKVGGRNQFPAWCQVSLPGHESTAVLKVRY